MNRIYFAAPLFTQAEWQWNQSLAEALRALSFSVHLPQDDALASPQGAVEFDARAIFAANVAAIHAADLLVAVLDQPDPDSGTCWECGYAFALGKPVIGLRTDLRLSGDGPGSIVNLMLAESCAAIVTPPPANRADVAALAQRLGNAIARLDGTGE